MLTSLFILCHTTFTSLIVLSCFLGVGHYADARYGLLFNRLLIAVGRYGHLIAAGLSLPNSAFSPVIIISRSSGLREGLKKMVYCNERR